MKQEIKKFIKQNQALSSLALKLREKRSANLMKKYWDTPIDSKRVLFFKQGGGYGDNPKAVAEYLHAVRPDIQLVWTVGQEKESVPDYFETVRYESPEFFKELAICGAWVCSTILPNGTIKRPGQMYIQTWHGDKFLKKIAKDSAADIASYKWRKAANTFCETKICNYFVTGCEWFVPIAASALDYKGAFLRCGMPRNDCLVNLDAEKCAAIKKALGIDESVKVLIYAPTFRDYEKKSGEIGTNIDLFAILDALEKKYRQKWICLMRAHHGTEITINNEAITDPRFMDVTKYPDMADLLMISDILISDYSSCGADFAITGKMVLMYQDDIDQYTTKGRTLYFSREESPYFTASNMEEALDIIHRVSEEDIKRNSKGILDFYDSFETGRGTETVGKVILDALAKIEQR